ncbi:hypothetical protein ACHAXT_010144 [Thalassiosira profunda]
MLSPTWPYQSISPLQAYLLGVSTCVLAFVAWNFFLRPAAAERTVSRRKSPRKSPFKNRRRSPRKEEVALPTTNAVGYATAAAGYATNDEHFLRPSARMASTKPVAQDRTFRRLAGRIGARAAARAVRKASTAKHVLARPAAQCSLGRGEGGRIGYRVVGPHPIARNRGMYNAKGTASKGNAKQTAKGASKVAPATASAYNDGSVWPSAIAPMNQASLELFRHMNTQPFRKEERLSAVEGVPKEAAKQDEKSESGKENVDAQIEHRLANDIPGYGSKRPSKVSSDLEKPILERQSTIGVKATTDEARDETQQAKPCLTVLVSNGVCEMTQAAHQKDALRLLDDLGILYETIDGMDPLQRETRDAFFQISGIRGNYPQLFASGAGDTHIYLGGNAWLGEQNNAVLAETFACK